VERGTRRGPTWEGKRQVYIPIFRRPGSNTIEVVEGVKKRTPEFLSRLPVKEGAKDSGLNLDVVADQSVFVRSAINSLTWEGLLGAVLASLMVMIFIGSVRSTVVIALTIPLSALVAVIGLYFTGNTLNAMTLGGLALVMGRLVDDPIVDIENTFRHLDMGKTPKQAALDSAMEIAMPVLVATITTVVVFFPVVFLFGMGKYLFTPLALSVAFAMFASYVLSRTLSPAFCAYFLKPHTPGEKRFWLFRVCDSGFEFLKSSYSVLLRGAMRVRWIVVIAALLLLVASLALYPLLGQELFPVTDASQIVINVRAPSGTDIENSEKLTQRIEKAVKEAIPEADRQMIVTDIGVLYDWPAGYTANSGPMDSTILVQLAQAKDRSVSSQEYARRLRQRLNHDFPGVEFAFNTGGMVSAALNFGLPAPINIQVEGRDMQGPAWAWPRSSASSAVMAGGSGRGLWVYLSRLSCCSKRTWRRFTSSRGSTTKPRRTGSNSSPRSSRSSASTTSMSRPRCPTWGPIIWVRSGTPRPRHTCARPWPFMPRSSPTIGGISTPRACWAAACSGSSSTRRPSRCSCKATRDSRLRRSRSRQPTKSAQPTPSSGSCSSTTPGAGRHKQRPGDRNWRLHGSHPVADPPPDCWLGKVGQPAAYRMRRSR
jgi:hypothetical protein